MISCGIENAIQRGIAKAYTFVVGAGGVSRIPVPENCFIIIHHFDYWHFIDCPAIDNLPAVGTLTINTSNIDLTPAFISVYQFGFVGSFEGVVDFTDLPGTLLDIVGGLAGIAPGWTVVGVDNGGGSFTFTFTTSMPGLAYNGIVAGFTPTDPQPFVTHSATAFAGGTNTPVTAEAFLRHATHQLEFRSKKSRNDFLIQEPVEITFLGNNPGQEIFYANLGGYYSKDTYMVHTESVQVNILGVPPVSEWGITFASLDSKSQENENPTGYGQAGGGTSQATVRAAIFDAALVTQQYLPLTDLYDNTTLIPAQYREQFRVDGNAKNALTSPFNNGGVRGNFPTYPLVNVDYIMINGNYNDFVKSSG